MLRTAPTAYDIHDLIRNRWSTRAFANQPVEPEKLNSLLEAARWAASGNNGQPWSFIVATKEQTEAHQKVVDSLMGFNTVWAKNAPVLLIAVAKTNAERPAFNKFAFYDVGQAVANLTIQAGHLGLFVHQMGGFEAEKVKAAFNIPDGYEVLTISAIGYYGGAEDLPDALRERETAPRTRKPLEEFVFSGNWGEPLNQQ